MGTFKFRQFSVCDDHASMKVGTDAVLLGSWTHIGESRRILDIGTGSGVIALMMAQRSLPHSHIDAVELLKSDSRQAAENIASSPWPQKVAVITTDLLDFKPGIKYDLIVCNPPYFSGSLLPAMAARGIARHDLLLTQSTLLESVVRLLSTAGAFSLILPVSEGDAFVVLSETMKLMLHRYTRFYSRRHKPQERSLLEFRFRTSGLIEDSMTLYGEGAQWTHPYTQLTKDFYLSTHKEF